MSKKKFRSEKELLDILEWFLPECELEKDTDGQLVLYTGLYWDEQGNLVSRGIDERD